MPYIYENFRDPFSRLLANILLNFHIYKTSKIKLRNTKTLIQYLL